MDKINQLSSDVKSAGATQSTILVAGQPGSQNSSSLTAATRVSATPAACVICAADQIQRTLAAFSIPARRLFTRFVPAWQQADMSQAIGAAIAALQVKGEVDTSIPGTPFGVRVSVASTCWQVVDFYKGVPS